jgi:glycerol-3-phosphate acyltransferase PlsY
MATRSRKSTRSRWLRHRGLVAAEATLIVGILKDFVAGWVKRSSMPDYSKVLFVMAATLGLLGGLYYLFEKLLARSVETTHQAVRSLPLPFSYWVAHAVLFFVLFLIYANVMGVSLV